MKHTLYDICYNAHRNTSFSPDKRAANACRSFDADAANVVLWGGDIAKHKALFLKWMAAKARCASSMIVGPARFPVFRMEKANRAEENHGREYIRYLETLEKKHREAAFYAANPHARPIRSDDKDAMERLQAKLAAAKEHHAHLKANPSAREHSFSLSYAMRDVRELERRIRYQQRMALTPPAVPSSDGEATPYIVNGAGARVYFEFDGKPAEDVRVLLKKNGFRWTPSRGHWGRLLTPNALAAAKRVASDLAANESTPCGLSVSPAHAANTDAKAVKDAA